MHETTIAGRLLEQVTSICAANSLDGAVIIHLEVGVMSGVESRLLEIAFERLVSDTNLSGSGLAITKVPLTGACDHCDTTVEIRDFNFRCPHCREPLRVRTGEELRLVSITTTEGITP